MKKNIWILTAAFLFSTGAAYSVTFPVAPGQPGCNQSGAGRKAGKKAGPQDGSGPIHEPGTGGGTGAGRRAGRK